MVGRGDAALEACLEWYRGDESVPLDPNQYCGTRDVFEGRLHHLLTACEKANVPNGDAALLVAVAGEVGNNAFDHNLGHWIDVPGCCFGYRLQRPRVLAWIADRGRGVLRSLQAAVPDLSGDQMALDMAFERVVSGRHPERRGNGLKFVRQVINGHDRRGLVAVSGRASLCFGGVGASLLGSRSWPTAQAYGTLVVTQWSFE